MGEGRFMVVTTEVTIFCCCWLTITFVVVLLVAMREDATTFIGAFEAGAGLALSDKQFEFGCLFLYS